MVEEKTENISWINNYIIILIIVLATFLGVMPASFALGSPKITLYFAIGSLFISAFYFLSIRPYLNTKSNPPVLAYLLAGVGSLSLISTIGLSMLLFYVLIYGITWLVTIIATWSGANWVPNFHLIAFYLSIIMMGLAGIVIIYQSTDNIKKQLFPPTAGIKHVFYELITERRASLNKRIILFILGLVIAIPVFIIFHLETNTIFYVFIQLYMYYAGYSLNLLGNQRYRRSPMTIKTVEALKKLLEKAGYTVIFSPRTGKIDIDPLLVGLDLFAHKNQHAFCLKVKCPEADSKPITWIEALGIKTGASALGQELDIKEEKVHTIIVLMGVKPDSTLLDFTKEESIRLVELNEDDINKILRSDDKNELWQKTIEIFGIDAISNAIQNGINNFSLDIK